MTKLILVLTIICVVSGLLLGITYSVTKEKITQQEQSQEDAALKVVLPQAEKFNDKKDYYEGIDSSGKIIGYAFMADGQGYSSVIKIMVGINSQKVIQGIKIISQQETPGLGTRIDDVKAKGTIWGLFCGKKPTKDARPWFQAQFTGKAAADLNEIQTITGSTITSDAVINAVKKKIDSFKISS